MIRPHVAIVHDYLTQRGGAERVVLALHRAFPDAPIFTSLYHPDGTFPEFAQLEIKTSPLNRVAALRRNHRAALPFLAPVFSAMHIDADVLICSSSGWAHGARTSGRKVVYCHAPARWLYQSDAYVHGRGLGTRAMLHGVRPLLVTWDRIAARSADVYVANSNHTRTMIHDAYEIDADVVFPPGGIDAGGPRQAVGGIAPGFFLCVSRLLAYKNVHAVLEAFRRLPHERLVVVGVGPEEPRLRALALPNVEFLASVTDDQLRWLYAQARALIAASYEDFGLTPVEAAAFGTPSIALRRGGYLDTVVEGSTGLFFDTPEPARISGAVRELSAAVFEARTIEEHARQFGEAGFRARLRELAGVLPAADSVG